MLKILANLTLALLIWAGAAGALWYLSILIGWNFSFWMFYSLILSSTIVYHYMRRF